MRGWVERYSEGVERYSEGVGDTVRGWGAHSEGVGGEIQCVVRGWGTHTVRVCVDRYSEGHTYLLQSSVSQHVDQRVDVGLTREVQPGPDVSVRRDHTL